MPASRLTVLLSLLLISIAAQTAEVEPQSERLVAITIDDLPTVQSHSLSAMVDVTDRLLGQIKAARVEAVGFVNEGKLHDGGPHELPERTALLEQWLDAGLTLGNHTYSHPDLNSTPLHVYRQDVLRGEEITRRLMQERGARLKYFRHPFLRAGATLQAKADLEDFLRDRGYVIAPVTIDNSEWIYAAAYDAAQKARDRALMRRVGEDYVRYMEEMVVFYEELSRRLFGREIGQILLIHANALNADYLDQLITMMSGRGYGFGSLDEVMQDPVYAQPDPYVGPRGLSWLERWAIGKKLSVAPEPAVPEFVNEAMRKLQAD